MVSCAIAAQLEEKDWVGRKVGEAQLYPRIHKHFFFNVLFEGTVCVSDLASAERNERETTNNVQANSCFLMLHLIFHLSFPSCDDGKKIKTY